MPALRSYQRNVIENARRALKKHGSCVLQMPTGAGKTRTATEIIATTRGVVWFVCHRREIIRQAAEAFTAAGLDFGIVAPAHDFEPNKRVQIASVRTLQNRIKKMRQPSLVIWDECHHVAAGSWAKIRESLPKAKHLGLTATPERLDGQGLSKWFKELVCGPSIKNLTPKYLSDFKYFAPSEPDLTKVRTGKGDYSKKDRERLMNSPVLIGDAISEYKKNISGKRAILFAASTDMSRKIVRRFNKAGITAAHVDATTSTEERDAAIAALRVGEIKVLSNVEVFTEGFDLPAIDAVILMRPTKSLALFLQMVGRALRNAPCKKRAYIFDHAGLVHTHHMPDIELEWSLKGNARERMIERVRKDGGRLRRCPECKQVHAERVPICDCGHKFAAGREIGEYDGQLYELRSAVPEGCITKAEFSRLHSLSMQAVGRAIENGLPNVDGFPIVGEADRWVSNWHAKNRPPRDVSNPDDYEPRRTFANRMRISESTLDRMIASGLPRHVGCGWIHIPRAVAFAKRFLDSDLKSQIEREHSQIEREHSTNVKQMFLNKHTSLPDYIKMRKLSYSVMEAAIREGAPIKKRKNHKHAHRFVDIREMDRWFTNRKRPPSKQRAPNGSLPGEYLSGQRFCLLFSSSLKQASKKYKYLRDRGLPTHPENGWVHIQKGLEWVRDNTNIKIPDSAWPKPRKQAA